MWFVAVTVLGGFFGVITGISYGVSTGNWPGAGWMFLGVMGYAYVAAVALWFIFLFDSWINS